MGIGFVVHQIESILTMRYYLMPEYFSVWSRVMMTKAGPPPLSFFLLSLLFTFLTGFAFSYIYLQIKDSLPKGYWKRAFHYADIMAGVYLVTFLFPVYLLFNVPFGLLVSWGISGFIVACIGSIVFVKVLR